MRLGKDLRDVAVLTTGSALITFSTLGLQSWDRDEAWMHVRVIDPSFSETLRKALEETTPPLWYPIAWAWTQVFGRDEVGLRSLSALALTATVAVVYFIGKELVSRRVGIVAGCLFAANPYLFWFAQEGRPYALLAFLTALSFLFFVRSLRAPPSRRDLALWAVASVLAMATHYFAVFVVVPEAIWLLLTLANHRVAGIVLAATALGAAALVPLVLQQRHFGGRWISSSPLDERLQSAGEQYTAGVTGKDLHAIVPDPLKVALVVAFAAALLALRGDAREQRAARIALVVGGSAVLAPIALALTGVDYVIDKNMLPALVPLGIALAAGLGVRRAGAVGIAATVALCGLWLSLVVLVVRDPDYRRPDWRQVSKVTGRATVPRAIVAPFNGDSPLQAYRGDWRRMDDRGAMVREIVVVGWGRARNLSPRLPPGFAPVERRDLHNGLGFVRFRSDRSHAVERHALAATEIGGACSADNRGSGCEHAVVWTDAPAGASAMR